MKKFNHWLKRIIEMACIGWFSGCVYVAIEMLYRGYSHYSMFWLAFVVGIVMASLNNWFTFDMPFELQVLISTAVATLAEFITGSIVNQNFEIWDYSNLWGTFANGQCNIIFVGAWMLISIFSIPLLDYVEWRFFNYEKPYYIVFGKRIDLFK